MNSSTVKLGDIAKVFNGKTPAESEQRQSGFPVLKIRDVDENGAFRGRFDSFVDQELANQFPDKQICVNDVMILNAAHNADYVASKLFFADERVAGALSTGEWLIIRADEEKVDPRFIHFWLQDTKTKYSIRLLVKGIHLYPKDVAELDIPLPSLTEQKRIASLLARADRLRQLRRTAHDLGDALLQSVFLEMFGDVAHSKWDKSELGELIEGFEAGVNYLPGSEGEKTSEWRVLKISAVTWGDFDPTESKAIREYEKFDDTHIVRQGDLLISRANTTELVGAVSLVKIIPPKVLLPDKLWRVKFREDTAILPEYTLHVLRQPELRKIIGDLATGSSGSMKNISMEKAYTLPIPVPPLSLQEKFAGMVARVESLRGRMGESMRQVEGLFESLLSESFA